MYQKAYSSDSPDAPKIYNGQTILCRSHRVYRSKKEAGYFIRIVTEINTRANPEDLLRLHTIETDACIYDNMELKSYEIILESGELVWVKCVFVKFSHTPC